MIPEVSLNSEFQILDCEKKSGSQKLDSENLISVQLQGPVIRQVSDQAINFLR